MRAAPLLGAVLVFLPLVPLVLLLPLLHTSPDTPPSACMHVLLRVFPHGLIVAFVRFVRSPARLQHYVCCSAAPFAEAPPMIMGILVREVDCWVVSEQQGSEGDV